MRTGERVGHQVGIYLCGYRTSGQQDGRFRILCTFIERFHWKGRGCICSEGCLGTSSPSPAFRLPTPQTRPTPAGPPARLPVRSPACTLRRSPGGRQTIPYHVRFDTVGLSENYKPTRLHANRISHTWTPFCPSSTSFGRHPPPGPPVHSPTRQHTHMNPFLFFLHLVRPSDTRRPTCPLP